MSKKFFLIIFAAGVAVWGLTLNGQTHFKDTSVQRASPVAKQTDELPEHVTYIFLFKHLTHLKKLANKHKAQGKDGSGFERRFKEEWVMDDSQFDKLNEIALSCESDVAVLDKKAQKIIEAFRATYPAGKVPEGVTIPPHRRS
jgi:hypothetical protein